MGERIDTLSVALDARGARRARNFRRVGLVLIALPVVAALAGMFGPTTATTRAVGPGVELTVTYPARTRSSVVTPLEIRVRHAGGFDAPVAVSVDHRLFDHLDFQNWYPNPDKESNDGPRVVYEFSPPTGDELVVRLDARTGPNQGFSRGRYRVSVLDAKGAPIATVAFRMLVWP